MMSIKELQDIVNELFKPIKIDKEDKTTLDKYYNDKIKPILKDTAIENPALTKSKNKFKLLSKSTHPQLNRIQDYVIAIGEIIYEHIPENRERNLSLTKLEEFLMWIEKSIIKGENKNV